MAMVRPKTLSEIPFNPEAIITSLENFGVEYIIIGSFGAKLYGLDCTPKDLDIIVPFSDKNLGRVVSCLESLDGRLWFKVDERIGKDMDDFNQRLVKPPSIERLKVIRHSWWATRAGSIDIVRTIDVKSSGLTYEQVFESSKTMRIYGFDLRVVSLDIIIDSNEYCARDKDNRVLPSLYALRNSVKN